MKNSTNIRLMIKSMRMNKGPLGKGAVCGADWGILSSLRQCFALPPLLLREANDPLPNEAFLKPPPSFEGGREAKKHRERKKMLLDRNVSSISSMLFFQNSPGVFQPLGSREKQKTPCRNNTPTQRKKQVSHATQTQKNHSNRNHPLAIRE